MNVSQAKAVCKYFDPQRSTDGKVRCSWLMADGEQCRRPDHYRCDLEIVKRARNTSPADKPLSVTRISNWLGCQRKWALEYVYKARPLVEAEWKIVGRIFASCRARIDAGEPYAIETDGLTHASQAKLKAVIGEYEKRHTKFGFPPLRSEHYVNFEFEGVRFGGYLDAISLDGKMIVEWKHAQDDYDLLKVARQLSVYAHSLPAVEKLVIAVAHKSKHREKKGEGPDAFALRVAEELAKDETLFTFTTFTREKLDTTGILHDMVVAFHQSQMAEVRGEFISNLGSMGCAMCEWNQLCAQHLGKPLGCDGPCHYLEVCEKVKRWHQQLAAGQVEKDRLAAAEAKQLAAAKTPPPAPEHDDEILF